MDDEIDLRRYIVLFVKKWKLILGVALLFGMVAFVWTRFVLSPIYEVRSLVVVTEPRYDLNFDPRFRTETGTELDFYRPLNSLAVSDEMLENVLNSLEKEDINSEITLDILRSMLSVDSEGVTELIELAVTGQDPRDITVIANKWAELFVIQANQLYGEGDDQNSLELQVSEANTDLQAAETALINFQSENDQLALNTEILSLETTYTELFNSRGLITETTLDIASFIEQLQTLQQSDPLSPQDETTLLLLQLKAFNVYQEGVQVAVGGQDTSGKTVREAVEYLQALQTTLSTKSADIEEQLGPLTERLFIIQTSVKNLETTDLRLMQEYNLASETYLTLSRKVDETRISAQVSSGTIKLASRPSVPLNPVAPSATVNTLIALILGGVTGIVWVLAGDFWHGVASAND